MLRRRRVVLPPLLVTRDLSLHQSTCTASLARLHGDSCLQAPQEAAQSALSSSTVSSATAPRSTQCHESWREWLPMEALQQIDTLTYLLGRYPRSEATSAARTEEGAVRVSEGSLDEANAVVGKAIDSVGAPSTRPKSRLSAKKAKLASLNASALPAKAKERAAPPVRTSVAPTTLSRSVPSSSSLEPNSADVASPAGRLWAEKPTPSPSLPAVAKGPLTPVDVVEELAQRWLRGERRAHAKRSKADAVAEAEWQALLRHPAHLFDDDAAVYSRFGMGAYVSPTLPGFTGLFRQQWQDFHVTEMFTPQQLPTEESGNANTPSRTSTAVKGIFCDAAPVSRDFNFRIPPMPDEFLFDADAGAANGMEEAQEDEAALSFFAVDVKQRIQELQAEEVRDKDLAAAAEVLSREQRRRAVPLINAPVAETPMPKEQSVVSTRVPTPHSANHVSSASNIQPHPAAPSENNPAPATGGRRNFLQCTLHKQHMAHGNALATIAQTLRIHPRSISVAGIKDYIGDTVQRVRLEHVSPAAALAANRSFREKRLKMTLSDFSYESAPLAPGDLFGNHFKVVLRDVDVPRSDLADAIAAFAEKGFPNYYGCQRFSWFAGRHDAAFALLRHNWLAFAFLFLNFTGKDRSLRELLQRPKKYPHPAQDEYRRGVVRRLRQISIEPTALDVAPFLSCPTLNAPLTHADGRPFSEVQELICLQLREAYFDLNVQSRRLTAQRLSSYLWNQVLSLRLHHVGGAAVLDGDLVAPASIRQLSTDVDDRQDWYHTFGDRISRENRHRYTIDDVVHPGFSFDAITLPDNIVGAYYEQVCDKYALDWMAQHSRSGLRDFREPPRPIIRKPLNLSYEYNADACVLTLRFALERGCYANVALSELMKSVRCLGSEEVTLLPLPEALWGALGEADPGHVTTLQDIYEGYEDGVGFMNEEAPVERAVESETKAWDHTGPFFLPPSEDPFRKAHRWGSQHLLRNSERKEKEAEDMKRMLFDYPLAKKLREGEVDTYAGHIVPLPPNASAKRVFAKVMQRKRRYAGSPKMVTRMHRSSAPASSRRNGGGKLPSFQSLNKNSWNFTW